MRDGGRGETKKPDNLAAPGLRFFRASSGPLAREGIPIFGGCQ